MAARTGTHTLSDLVPLTQPVTEYGLEAVAQVITESYNAHNRILSDQLDALSQLTNEYQTAAPREGDAYEFVPADEFSRAPTQKSDNVVPQGLPLYRRQVAVGFTADYLRRVSVGELATRVIGVQRGDVVNVQRQLRYALMNPTNTPTFFDEHDNRFDIKNIKALYNADGSSIPESPVNLSTFDPATHTHYLANTTLTGVFVDSLVSTVAEHALSSNIMVGINKAEEVAMRALTGFAPLLDVRVEVGANTPLVAANATLDTSRFDNRVIGYFNGAEVHVKSWIPAGYLVVWNATGPRPLRRREHSVPAERGLRLVGTNSVFPLEAQYTERKIGFGAYSRGAAAVGFIGASTYAVPANIDKF